MKHLVMTLFLWAASTSVFAAPSIAFHGFLAQGIIQSQGSEFIGEPDKWSLNLTETGINARITMNNKIQLVAQAVYLDGGNRYPQGARLDYAFADVSLVSNSAWQTNMHIGRFKNPHWLFSATQDVPHTRPSIILPQSVYFDAFRDVSVGSDGLALVSRLNSDKGEWVVNWSYGKNDFSDDFATDLLGGLDEGRIEQEFIHQFSIGWTPYSAKWQLRASYLETSLDYQIDLANFSLNGASRFSRYQLSARYSAQHYELTSEILSEQVEISGVPLIATNRTGIGGYFQAQYFVDPKISLLLRYDTFYPDREDKSGEALSDNFVGLVPDYAGFMETYTIGLSWKFAKRWRIHAEHHWVDGAARLNTIVTPQTLTRTDENWQTTAIQVMTWF